MSIIIDPKIKTNESVVRDIKVANYNFLGVLKRNQTNIFNMVWNNKNFTAKEIVDGFGTSAVDMFILSSKIVTLIQAIDPDYELIPGDFIINEDGSVTVTREVDEPVGGE